MQVATTNQVGTSDQLNGEQEEHQLHVESTEKSTDSPAWKPHNFKRILNQPEATFDTSFW